MPVTALEGLNDPSKGTLTVKYVGSTKNSCDGLCFDCKGEN